MARPLTVHIPHHLGRAEARRRIEEGFAGVRQQLTGGLLGVFSFQDQWEGDHLHFQGGGLGQSIRGKLEILDDSVRIDVELPELLAKIADQIAGKLKAGTQRLLERPK